MVLDAHNFLIRNWTSDEVKPDLDKKERETTR